VFCFVKTTPKGKKAFDQTQVHKQNPLIAAWLGTLRGYAHSPLTPGQVRRLIPLSRRQRKSTAHSFLFVFAQARARGRSRAAADEHGGVFIAESTPHFIQNALQKQNQNKTLKVKQKSAADYSPLFLFLEIIFLIHSASSPIENATGITVLAKRH
jgi:hypothetical protein